MNSDKGKDRKFIAFQQITFTKVLALFFTLLFTGVVVVSIYFKLNNPDIIILDELKTVATVTGAYLGGYLGKSGYEYYSRSRYTTINLERYGGHMSQSSMSDDIPPSSGGVQI